MGGKPDWMYNAERQHIFNTTEERWKDGCWAKIPKNLETAVWVGIKKNGIFPEVPDGIEEALCFDDDLLGEDFTLWIRVYKDEQWSEAYRLTGYHVPFVPNI